MRGALLAQLFRRPAMHLREMAEFLYREFKTVVTSSSIRRALKSVKWSKKATRQVAAEQNADLQDWYFHNLERNGYLSYHMVYIDESGFHKTDGLRRAGWAPQGVTPI
jgi:hypothetical protein